MASEQPRHLDPSDLGTKKYWDDTYARELENYAASPDDEGTVWFADSGAEEKVLNFLEEYSDEAQLFKDSSEDHGNPASSFLDLGTGNGHLLFELRDAGWEGHMLGVDYSAASVRFAFQIAQTRLSAGRQNSTDEPDPEEVNGSSPNPEVYFEEYDILNPSPLKYRPREGFDVVLDKGTFDAISLSSDVDSSGQRVFESYATQVLPLVRENGLFVITSCNWTEDELRAWFEATNSKSSHFVFHDRIEYPSFTFGGKKGQSVVTICFKKTGS